MSFKILSDTSTKLAIFATPPVIMGSSNTGMVFPENLVNGGLAEIYGKKGYDLLWLKIIGPQYFYESKYSKHYCDNLVNFLTKISSEYDHYVFHGIGHASYVMPELFWRMKREPSPQLMTIREKINGHVYETPIDPLNAVSLKRNFASNWLWPIESTSVFPFADPQQKATDLFSAVNIKAPALMIKFLNTKGYIKKFRDHPLDVDFDNLHQTLKSKGIDVTTCVNGPLNVPFSIDNYVLFLEQINGLNQYLTDLERQESSKSTERSDCSKADGKQKLKSV